MQLYSHKCNLYIYVHNFDYVSVKYKMANTEALLHSSFIERAKMLAKQ